MVKDYTFRRGDICWYNGESPSGNSYVLQGRHPAVIVSPDYINETSGTVIIAPMTSNTSKHLYANQLDIVLNGYRSRIKCEQLRVVDKTDLMPPHAKLDSYSLDALNRALMWALGLNVSEKSFATLAVISDC